MADDADLIAERELRTDVAIHSLRYNIPKGRAGACEDCGEDSPRLIGGRCARCRDDRR